MKHQKCLSCKHYSCANLLLKVGELDGGELYVLNESIKQNKIAPCQPMIPYHSCLLLVGAAYNTYIKNDETLGEDKFVDPPLLALIWQCLYDLKASTFLALTAHYRCAIQLLRPIVENILVGLYFEERLVKASEDERNQVWADFDNWREGTYKLNGSDLDFTNSKRWLEKNKGITDDDGKRLGKLWGELGKKYIHPYFGHTNIGEENHSISPAATRYDMNHYCGWLEFFQNIIEFIIEKIFYYYPAIAETLDAKEALGSLKNLESLEEDWGIKMIKSKYLKDRIAQVPDIDELLELNRENQTL